MSADHVVAHDGTHKPFGFECLHCGALLGLRLPVSVDVFAAAGEEFVRSHRGCAKPATAQAVQL